MKTNKSLSSSERESRRSFTKTITAAFVAAPLVASAARAQTPAPKQAPAPPNPQPSPALQSPTPSPLAEAYAEVARARFGDHLTPEELERVKRDLESNVRTTERLRAAKLQNADEPDFVFSV